MSNVQSNLVSGSQWLRKKAKGYAVSTVLHVTNLGLKDSVLEEHPQQVVFLTEDLKVFSMTVDAFTRNRQYQGIDPLVESLVDQLLNPSEEDDLDDADGFTDTIAQLAETQVDLDEDEADEDVDEDDTDDEAEDGEDVMSTLDLVVGAHPLAEKLETSLVSYTESPYHNGDTLHVLKFTNENGLTPAEVAGAFMISDPNAIQQFSVGSPYLEKPVVVDVDSYVSTFYELMPYETLIVVYLLSAGAIRDYSSQAVTETQVVNQQDFNPDSVLSDMIEHREQAVVSLVQQNGIGAYQVDHSDLIEVS